jgi:hypothetical protein
MDDDMMTSEDLEKKRQLRALQNMMELDKNTYQTLQKRDEEESAALAQRRELSERLTRHLALQRKAAATGSSQVSSWSRSSSRSVREVGVGEENVFANPPPPLHGFRNPVYYPAVTTAAAAVSVLTSTDLLRVEDATTMTEKSSRTVTPMSMRESPDSYPTAMAEITHGGRNNHHHREAPQQPAAAVQQRDNHHEQHLRQHYFQTAEHDMPSRGTSTQTTRGTITNHPLPARSHDPMEAFAALRSRYMNARGRHHETPSFMREEASFADQQLPWRRV